MDFENSSALRNFQQRSSAASPSGFGLIRPQEHQDHSFIAVGDEVWLLDEPTENRTMGQLIGLAPRSNRFVVTGISFNVDTRKRMFQLCKPQTEDLYHDGALISEDNVSLARKGRAATETAESRRLQEYAAAKAPTRSNEHIYCFVPEEGLDIVVLANYGNEIIDSAAIIRYSRHPRDTTKSSFTVSEVIAIHQKAIEDMRADSKDRVREQQTYEFSEAPFSYRDSNTFANRRDLGASPHTRRATSRRARQTSQKTQGPLHSRGKQPSESLYDINPLDNPSQPQSNLMTPPHSQQTPPSEERVLTNIIASPYSAHGPRKTAPKPTIDLSRHSHSQLTIQAEGDPYGFWS